ncbi:MAG: glycoside hydrolase family 99-like domain-containing protein [Betaproteobacteria bacterium]|nr:glycoside hydrolase family 99-like domain-containing protein [Betaproteobacteria bacterium]
MFAPARRLDAGLASPRHSARRRRPRPGDDDRPVARGVGAGSSAGASRRAVDRRDRSRSPPLPSGRLALNAGNPNRRDGTPVRAIAFYLPQYHRIPENDRWWGEGFTEWTNVRRAKPLFPGHEQPRVPGPLGYYDLTDPRVADAQAALARSHGVHGFCYYYYWFNGKRLLERPLEEMVARGTPDFPFCVCWANENWTRRWDGLDSDVLMEQRYDLDDSVHLFDEFARLFRDPRYIRVGGRPLLLVYKTTLIPSLRETVDRWRRRAAAAGVGDPYLVSCETGGHEDALAAGFDALVEFPPHRHRAIWLNGVVAGLDPAFEGVLTSYRSQVIQSLRRAVGPRAPAALRVPVVGQHAAAAHPRDRLRGVEPGTVRLLGGGDDPRHPRALRRRRPVAVRECLERVGEGCCLEPDRRYGTQYLDALRAAIERGAGPADALCAMPRWTTSGVAPPASVVAGI